MVDLLNRYGAHPNQTKPFVPGQYYKSDVRITGVTAPDNIETTALYASSGQQIGIRNETLPDHFLHPGIVERRVVEHNEHLHILTEGGGAGPVGLINVLADEAVWRDIDAAIIRNY